MNRFEAARICIDGASNPRRIARALVDALDEVRYEGGHEITDPAVVLIFDQLMQVMGAYHGTDPAKFNAAYTALLNHEKENAA